MRKMQEQDRAIFLQMAKEFYHSPAVFNPVPEEYFERTFAELIARDLYVEGYILEQGTETAGYVLISKTYSQEIGGMVAWIEEIYVRPAFQGQGLGSAFLRWYEQELDLRQVRRLRLEVEPENSRAAALYARLGFEPHGYLQLVKKLPEPASGV